ncbi:MAG: hypothetical protein AB1483_05350 [Candidatus Zixiibacteriota bacterium]
MIKVLLLVCAVAFVIGCSSSTGPGETETFDLGYGESVANCDQKAADAVCRGLGWDKATGYDCRTVPVNSPLGYWEQDVMFKVTCWRPL